MIVVCKRQGRLRARVAGMKDICIAVYTLVQLIPVGFVTSYSEIARILGVPPRLVAMCLARNKDIVVVPCHRVVYSSGDLGGYSSFGVEFKKKLLLLEGVRVEGSRVSRECFTSLHRFLGVYTD